jgi:non-homologous end joining protein Ku
MSNRKSYGEKWVKPLSKLILDFGLARSLPYALAQEGDREVPVLVEPLGAGLLMSTLYPEEERYPSEFEERADDSVPSEMIEIAEDLITRRAADFGDKRLRLPSTSKRG